MAYSIIGKISLTLMMASVIIGQYQVAQAGVVNEALDSFWEMFPRNFSSMAEMEMRGKILIKLIQEIEEWNKEFLAGNRTFQLKLNHMSDWTPEEFFAMANGIKDPSTTTSDNDEQTTHNNRRRRRSIRSSRASLPARVNYNTTGCVPPVRNQYSCGSCYAFSTADLVAAQVCLTESDRAKWSSYTLRSPQQIMDCGSQDPDYGSGIQGCNGGWPYDVLSWLQKTRRLTWEQNYPYANQVGSCQNTNGAEVAANDGNFKYVTLKSLDEIKNHVANHGPVIATFRVVNSFQNYGGSGVYQETNCADGANHAPVIYGYDKTSSGQEYWIVKNSWGTDWGDYGWAYIALGQNTCKIEELAWGIL